MKEWETRMKLTLTRPSELTKEQRKEVIELLREVIGEVRAGADSQTLRYRVKK
jgi:hypothetical protein